jgi:hypothetical protein
MAYTTYTWCMCAPAGSGARKSAGLGLLLSKLDLNISADALEVYHDAQVCVAAG